MLAGRRYLQIRVRQDELSYDMARACGRLCRPMGTQRDGNAVDGYRLRLSEM
jgi:hypothetical protein